MAWSEFLSTALQVIIAVVIASFAFGMFFLTISFGVSTIRSAIIDRPARRTKRDADG